MGNWVAWSGGRLIVLAALAWLLAAILSVIVVWQVTQPGGVFNPTLVVPPHAPPVIN